MLDHYTPVLIDVETELEVVKKFPILQTTPAVLWIDFDGEDIFQVQGSLPLNMWTPMAEVAIDRVPDRTVPAGYKALLKLRDQLRAAMAGKDREAAEAAIAKIEKAGQGVRIQAEAAAAKRNLP